MTLIRFHEPCAEAFSFLVDAFGFDAPRPESSGPELTVVYEKGLHTVCVVMEGGLAPLVELHFPAAGSGERAVPWLERQGVPRARRVRGLRGRHEGPAWPQDEEGYLRALARETLEAEGWRFEAWRR